MCYLTLRCCTTQEVRTRFELVFERFRHFTEAAMSHPDYNTCRTLVPYVKLNGFPFCSSLCNACSEVESPMTLIKLQQLKEEAQFTTTSIRVKLTSYCEIAKLLLRISETRRKKSVRKISIYFSNHAISSAVELKRNDIWVLAKEFQVAEGHSEVKMDFPVPFIARCLRIEFTLFHDKGIVEVLMCPRCSAVVRSQPGVCLSCGENALQCLKCRAINYNERDPFLCNSCGFCKYGKFDFALYCRRVPGVDQITNDDELGKSVQRMYYLVERAEQCIQAVGNSVTLLKYHMLLKETSGFQRELPIIVECPASTLGSSTELSAPAQAIGQCYSNDCKKAMENLRSIHEELMTLKMVALEYERGEVSFNLLDDYARSKPNCLACLNGLAAAYGTFLNCCVRKSGSCKERLFKNRAWRAFILGTAMTDNRFRPRMIAIEIIASMAYNNFYASVCLCRQVESKVLFTLRLGTPCHSDEIVNCFLPILSRCSKVLDGGESIWAKCVLNIVKEVIALTRVDSGESIILCCLRIICGIVKECSAYLTPCKVPTNGKYGAASAKAFAQSALNLIKMSVLDVRNGQRFTESTWLEKCIFHNSPLVRLLAVYLLCNLCHLELNDADVFGYMIRLEKFGPDRGAQFLAGLVSILKVERWSTLFCEESYFLKLTNNINTACEQLSQQLNHTATTDASLGFNLSFLSEVFKLICANVPNVRKQCSLVIIKRAMMGYFVSYRHDVWRTGLLNVARDNFLAVLDDILNGGLAEPEEKRYLPHFLNVCVQLLRSLPSPESRNAFLTFDRMCAAIDTEDKGLTEFKVNIEKDPAQEDFLQGRMSGSPYSSSDPDMGPTMRDIKRKICNDCELVSLLEDDNGMELLVDGKIISLDLEVAEVFKRVWYPAHGVDPMVIVYRMRGLLGDATEEFVHGFNGAVERSESEEFNLSYLFTIDCLTVMLERLEMFDKPPTCDLDYIYPLLELFHFAVKLIGVPFRAHAAQLPEKILYIVKRLYEEAISLSDDEFKGFVDFPQIAVDLIFLLCFLHDDCNIPIGCKEEILRTVGLLTLGSPERIGLVVKYFEGCSDFTRYDDNVSAKVRAEGEMMCTVMSGVATSSFGCLVKDKFVEAGYLSRATDYLLSRAPAACRQGLTLDSDELQEFVARPGLRFSLKFLNELCRGHEASQLHVATDCVPIVHRLESVSSKEHIGSLAEGLMEILRENEVVAKKVEEARLETKRRKKQIAMEVRKKQLRRLGMQLTDNGAIVICSDRLKEFTEVAKESELNCVICRESLVGCPKKPIGLYTFSKVVDIEPYEQSAVKAKSIFTVTYLNAIHYDCHVVAVRSATNRAEWESAMLHNASTRCNGLLPLLGPQTSDGDYGSALAKHQRYVYHHTGFNDFGLKTSVHDLKFLMFRIAKGESLSTDTGGGGRGANLSFLPHLAVVCLFYITSTNAYNEQACLLEAFLAQPVCEWRTDAFSPLGCLYYVVLHLLINDKAKWETNRIFLLKRLLAMAGYRKAADDEAASSSEPTAELTAYDVYAAYCNFFYLVDRLYHRCFPDVSLEGSDNWSAALKSFVAANHDCLLQRSNRLLSDFEDCLQSTSFCEFCDVAGVLNEIPDPDQFLLGAVNSASEQPQEQQLLFVLWSKWMKATWTADNVRRTFVGFFEQLGYAHFQPASLVPPKEDRTLLFTNAGVVQFKPILLGTAASGSRLASLTKAVNYQRCVRLTDLDVVGWDRSHLSFFEMLGNWSFNGHLSKKIVCQQAWSLLTDVFQIPKERLVVSFFGGDESNGIASDLETREVWLEIGIKPDNIAARSIADNFWQLGHSGPCGPCTEIYFRTDDEQVIELWNIVFMDYHRLPESQLVRLSSSHIDTGLGLERLCAVLQKVDSPFCTDLFRPIMEEITRVGKLPPYADVYGTDDPDNVFCNYRIIADHCRMCAFALADGVLPEAHRSGYVLRKTIRRAIYSASLLLPDRRSFLHQVVSRVIDVMASAYPYLESKRETIVDTLLKEEESFAKSLSNAKKRFSRILSSKGPSKVTMLDLFLLYNTFGLPRSVIEDLAVKSSVTFSAQKFDELLCHHKEASRTEGAI
ncbi:hypothetical protein M513_04004 [Trichuris suis]|uniref:alanine--tRNA ligase n=1 Tax=Trichuris suis TaxID=68888 RepID=A0A085MCZ0_9BILA|nr:hypothetical protein M513_04004 [Trichuris suis]